MRCTRGVPFWDLARASAHAVGEWVSKGYAAESTRLFDLGVKLLRMDTIIRETANDPSTIGRAYSVTVRLGHETVGHKSSMARGPMPGSMASGRRMANTAACSWRRSTLASQPPSRGPWCRPHAARPSSDFSCS